MKISASIMAHPERAESVNSLLGALDRPVPVYWDPEGNPSGNADRVWRVARAAWSMFDPGAERHVLLQDDAVPCPDLLAGLELALDHVPDDVPVSLYLGAGRTVPMRWEWLAHRADVVGASWVRGHRIMWGVGLVVPTALIPKMIDDCDRRSGVPDDMRVSGWFSRRRVDTWYTWPSLVDHRGVPSLTKHRASDRRARRHLLGSAAEVSWNGPVVTDPMITRSKGSMSAPRVR